MATGSWNIPLPEKLDLNAANLCVDFRRFNGQWKNYIIAAKVSKETAECQVAILLVCIGFDAYVTHESMTLTKEQRKSTTDILEAFERYYVG